VSCNSYHQLLLVLPILVLLMTDQLVFTYIFTDTLEPSVGKEAYKCIYKV